MGTMGSDTEALVSLADLAEMAGVSRPAVSNWRRRNPDFPQPVAETGATSLFRLGELKLWMAKYGKRLDARSVDQLIWSALNPARGTVLPEEAAQAGMTLLAYLALALRADQSMPSALRAAVVDSERQKLDELVAQLNEQAAHLGLGGLFPTKIVITWSQASRFFLGKVLDLALEYGVGEAFDALIAAYGRGSRGEGEHTTPPNIANLIMSLAAPVQGVVIDPACGYGSFLLAASETADEQIKLIGQDVDLDVCRIARLRMFVYGRLADIICRDTLQAPGLFDDSVMDLIKADLVVADPPLGMNWHPELADGKERMPYGIPPSGRADMAWLQDGISRLKPSGVAIFVLGSGALFRGGAEAEIRSQLIESGCIRAVISLPSALYPTTNIPVSLWIVNKPCRVEEERTGRDNVLLIDASRLGNRRRSRTELAQGDVTAITNCFRVWHMHGHLLADSGVRAAAVPVDSLLASGGNLNPARWIEDPADGPEQRLARIAAAERQLRAADVAFTEASFSIPPLQAGRRGDPEDRWVTRELTDLAMLIRPRRIDPDLIGNGTTPLIRVGDVASGLTITPSGRLDSDLATGKFEFTRPGDIVIVPDRSKPLAAVDSQGGAIVGAPLQIARPLPGSIDPILLAALITSIAPRYAVGTTVGHVDLTSLEVPCPDPSTARRLSLALQALDRQRYHAMTAIKAIDELRSELVDGVSSQALRLKPLPPNEEEW